jgi:hypothetical protein
MTNRSIYLIVHPDIFAIINIDIYIAPAFIYIHIIATRYFFISTYIIGGSVAAIAINIVGSIASFIYRSVSVAIQFIACG